MKGKILLAVVVVLVAAIALLSAGAAQASITTTKHNLSPTGTGTYHATDNTQQSGEICVWCHTPHAANNAAFTGAPLWNKATPTGTYTMYGTTIAGAAPDGSPNGISKACLSCHDGVNAINSLVNAAGSGGVVAAGANVAFGATPAGTAFPMPAGSTNLGTTLADDHPVSITYTAGHASLVATTAAFSTTGTVGTVLRGGKVECSSCHDPHAASGDVIPQGTAGALFLRMSNTGSALCLACHAK